MPDVKISDSPAQLDQILRPLGITRSSKNYRVLCECVALICEQEDRLEAVQKEIYTPISKQRRCKWSAIQSAVRRAAEKAWALNPEGVQQLAGYPLTGAARLCTGERPALAVLLHLDLPAFLVRQPLGGIGSSSHKNTPPWVHFDKPAQKRYNRSVECAMPSSG